MSRTDGHLRGPLRALLALVAAALACGAPPSAEVCASHPEALALDPVYVTLGIQETIRLDQPLAETVADVIDRARTVEPHLFRIHTRPPWSPDSLYIWAEREEVSQAWRAGELLTGVAELDFLLTEYFVSEVEASADRPDDFVVYFAEPLNAARLLERFTAIEGIAGSVLWAYGDSNEIDVALQEDGWHVTFTLGWGDCPAGCIYHHRWEVVVADAGGEAVLLREGGESAEWFMDCVPVALPRGRE